MINLPTPPANSSIRYHSEDQQVVLSWVDRPRSGLAGPVGLIAFAVVWVGGIALALSGTLASAGLLAPPSVVFLVGWGGIGGFILFRLVRQRLTGTDQRLTLAPDRLRFEPKLAVPRARLMTQRPIHHRHRRPGRGPLRVEDLTREEVAGVRPGPNAAVVLDSSPGLARLGRSLQPEDAHYLLDVLTQWHQGA